MAPADEMLQLAKDPIVLDLGCTNHIVDLKSSERLFGRLVEEFQLAFS